MGFIADKIRIAKDGSVTTIADPADKPGATTTVWTAKMVCAELLLLADCDIRSAKMRITKLMNDHYFNLAHVNVMLDWIDRNWNNERRENRVYIILHYFNNKCP